MRSRAALPTAGFDALPAQTAVLDAGGEIRYANRAWRQFGEENGLADEYAHVGTNYLEVCTESEGEDATAAARGIHEILAGEREACSFEYPCHSPDRERWFTMRAEGFERANEQFVLVMHLDITDRRLAEKRVREQAERMETFARLLSHDLRNPLSVAMAEATELEDPDAKSSLLSSLGRMETIVADALVLLRTDTAVETRPVRLGSLVDDAWSNVETGAATVHLEDDLAIRADPDLVAHLFENLFCNAVEHGTDGRDGQNLTVTVGALEAASDGEDDAEPPSGFFVADDGVGIPETDRERLLEAGYTTSPDGSGFGLAIVEQVADAHGWSVAVTDGRDGGTRVEVTGVSALEGDPRDL